MTIKLITSFVLAFLFATAFGKYYIPWLRAQKAGQEIKGQVEWHKSKSGTPPMVLLSKSRKSLRRDVPWAPL